MTSKTPSKPKDEALTLLENLKWVAKAVKTDLGYKVRTKPGVFKTELTHSIRGKMYKAYDEYFGPGKMLEKPVSVPLPEYWIHLTPEHFLFALVKKPQIVREGRFGVIPTYHHTFAISGWRGAKNTCYGSSYRQYDRRSTADDYRDSKDFVEKAMTAAIYLQSAEPHYGETWYRTAFAYRLGLVGEEFREDAPVPEESVPKLVQTITNIQ